MTKQPKKTVKALPRVTFTTKVVTTATKPVYHYLLVETDWVKPLGFTGNIRRCVCTVNGRLTFNCALMPSGQKGKYYISINKVKRDAAGVGPGGEVEVELVRDESTYGMPMPEEFQAVLDDDAEGSRLFHALTNGKQRTLLYYTAKYKDIDRRIETTLAMLKHLKNNDGKIDYKSLSQELKTSGKWRMEGGE